MSVWPVPRVRFFRSMPPDVRSGASRLAADNRWQDPRGREPAFSARSARSTPVKVLVTEASAKGNVHQQNVLVCHSVFACPIFR